jgi:hypothetical protein
MDHDAVVRQSMTERYLLDELDSDARAEFEEHYFDCPECAADVYAGALFVEHGKAVLDVQESKSASSEKPVLLGEQVPVPARSGWFGWLRPAIAMPAFALLLAVIGYQVRANRLLQQEANTPQILASAVVNVDHRGSEPVSVPVHAGQAFGLSLNVPPDGTYSFYKLDLYSPQGSLVWSRTIAGGNATLSLYIPGSNVPGSDRALLTLAVHGITAGGESEDLGRYPIELQNQK